MAFIKEILVIGRNFHPDGKETAADISAALVPYMQAKDISVKFLPLKDIVFDISNDHIKVMDGVTGRELNSFQAVLMTNWFSHASVRKDMALTLALYFERYKIPAFNTEALHSRSTSKLSQMMLAALHGVPIARTIFSLNLDHTQKYMASVDFPQAFIFKDAQASRGKGNYLLKSVDEIQEHKAEHSEKHPFLVQERIIADSADFRFFVAGGKVRVVIKRMGSVGSHLNNTSAGASTEIIPVNDFNPETLHAVDTMSEVLHREVTGIDIMFDKQSGKPYFLEANPIPQIATGSNVTLKLQALADALEEAVMGSAQTTSQGDTL